jgi:hypothetical protein
MTRLELALDPQLLVFDHSCARSIDLVIDPLNTAGNNIHVQQLIKLIVFRFNFNF